MDYLHILNSKEIKNINIVLDSQFEVSLPKDYIYLLRENGKLYMMTRDFEKIDPKNVRVDNVGMYIATITESQARLSIEGSQLLGKDAKKGIVDIEDEQLELWIRGEDLSCDEKFKGPVIVRHKTDFYGCGIAKNGTILNHVPKERRIK